MTTRNETIENETPENETDWLTDTPDEANVEYWLSMVVDSTHLQDIDLTREEFIELKKAIARIRGLEVPEDAEKSENKSNEGARAKLLKIIDDLDPKDYERLAALGDAIMNNRGSITPAEDFIDSIALRYAQGLREGNGITPATIQNYLEEFRDDFEMAVQATRRMSRHHPELIGAKKN